MIREPMPDDVSRPDAPDLNLRILAWALCADAQAMGYDHKANPTMIGFETPYPSCPRHLGIATSVRHSLSRDMGAATVRPEDRPLDAAWAAAEAALPEEWRIEGVQLVDTSDDEDINVEQAEWEAEASSDRGQRSITALGQTPAAALRALCAALEDNSDAGSRAGLNHRASGLTPDRDASDGLELRDASSASAAQQERFKWAANERADRAEARIAKAVRIIEDADRRAEAADGPVLHVRDTMTDGEWRALYVALTENEPAARLKEQPRD